MPYFQDFPDTAKPAIIKTIPFKTPVIQSDDILSITIQTIDNDITNLLNNNNGVNGGNSSLPVAGSSTTPGTPNQSAIAGYLVDKAGNVELPFIGEIKLAGLTTSEAHNLIKKEANKYFNNPVVNVRFANFKITVLGEVNRPASYIAPNEKINLFDALGMAGDLTIFGKRENVLLLRDTLGDKQMIRLNLNSKDIVSSPYFYLQPNDIVYVEPSKYKIASVDAIRNRNITLAASALTILLVLVTRIGK
ncbi:polysaccharide biosynthesis/export family protein [Panacibacter ginsenosidivorans]|uniref:polysaccharide biosynthesis/export family protein n=1 Tax=Panacibacter ginsenosidivorans TaxID=1813871 RepID=UPI001CEF94AD|nr:polysaccharide biosynthesis/export family protein [Panacibacter ginsenosidivorans]